MISSEDLEIFCDRVRALYNALGKYKSAEVKDISLINKASDIAKDWLKYSQLLRQHNIVDKKKLEEYDSIMSEVHNATKLRTRASSYRTKLKPANDKFNDDIVIPVIRFEGSPEQIAARQLILTFSGHLTTDEESYIEEAARCSSLKCIRASLVLLWAAAVARFHRSIENAGFNAYNQAVDTLKDKKGHPFNKIQKAHITSLPELQRTRDYDLIVVGMELWKYDLQVFQELERLLSIRNSAAHPGMYEPTPLDLQQFALKLDDLVFSIIHA